jgi:hypothetical protein
LVFGTVEPDMSIFVGVFIISTGVSMKDTNEVTQNVHHPRKEKENGYPRVRVKAPALTIFHARATKNQK